MSDENGLDLELFLDQYNKRQNTNILSLLSVIDRTDTIARLNRKIADKLQAHATLSSFTNLALESSLSSTLVQAFMCSPQFKTFVKGFPEASQYNRIPEHPSSYKAKMGLESLENSVTSVDEDIQVDLKALVAHTTSVLDLIPEAVRSLKAQIDEDRMRLVSCDLPDDVVAVLEVNTFSAERFNKIFAMIESYLSEVSEFKTQDLREDPDKVEQELDSLTDIVNDLGRVLGLCFNGYGLADDEKGEEFHPIPGSLGEKDLNKSALLFYMTHCDTILDALEAVHDNKDTLIQALTQEAESPPLNSDSRVGFTRSAHATMMSCYVTLLTKLIREALMLVSAVLTAANRVLEAERGDLD